MRGDEAGLHGWLARGQTLDFAGAWHRRRAYELLLDEYVGSLGFLPIPVGAQLHILL